jgi:hypothetical protein
MKWNIFYKNEMEIKICKIDRYEKNILFDWKSSKKVWFYNDLMKI